MDAMIHYLPSPQDRPAVKATALPTKEDVLLECNDEQPLVAQAFKTVADPFVGKLTYFRVYTGRLSSDGSIYNANREKSERVGQVFIPRGKVQIPVDAVAAGDIGAVAKLQETSTGDTLGQKDTQIMLPGFEFLAPSYSVALTAKSKGDEDKLVRVCQVDGRGSDLTLRKDAESRELIVSGMGDVHIDVMVDRLKRKFGVEVLTATPSVPYRETLRKPVRVEGRHKSRLGATDNTDMCGWR